MKKKNSSTYQTTSKTNAPNTEEKKLFFVNYCIRLIKEALREGTYQEKHDRLCQLMVKIALHYPNSIAPNPGDITQMPIVFVDKTSKPEGLSFKLFRRLYDSNADFLKVVGVQGDIVFFLTLTLWYELYFLRGAEELNGRQLNYNDIKLEETIRRLQRLDPSQRCNAACRRLPLHFTLKVKNMSALCHLATVLKEAGWLDKNTAMEDWIYRLTGKMPAGWSPSEEPISISGLNQCHYIVKHVIFDNCRMTSKNWEMVQQVFTVKHGNIANVFRANTVPSGANIIDPEIKKIFSK